MADPLTVIGCIGAIVSIGGAISKAISTLNGLRSRWMTADLTLLTLATQLMALRAALSKIQSWMEESYSQALHYQLIMDLDVSVACCRLLVSKLSTFLCELSEFEDRPLDFAHRLKVSFGHRKADDIEKLLQQQVAALTLLITALNCTTISQQERSLRRLRSLKGDYRVNCESTSLFGLRDADSFMSKWTDNLSKFSIVFDFDPDILSTRVYQRVVRNSLRQAWKQAHQTRPKKFRVEKVLLLGNDETSKDRIVNKIHETYLQQGTAEQIASCRLARLKACVKHTKDVIQVSDYHDNCFSQQISKQKRNTLASLSFETGVCLDEERAAIQVMMDIWQKALVEPLVMCTQTGHATINSSPYFLEELRKLESPDLYPPTAADFLKAQAEQDSHEISLLANLRGKALQMTVLRMPDTPRLIKGSYISRHSANMAFVAIDLEQYERDLGWNLELLRLMTETIHAERKPTPFALSILFRHLDVFNARVSQVPLRSCIPTYNESDNFEGLIACIKSMCSGICWRYTLLQDDEIVDLVRMVADHRDYWRERLIWEGGFV